MVDLGRSSRSRGWRAARFAALAWLALAAGSLRVAPLFAGDESAYDPAPLGEIHGGPGGDAFRDRPAGRLATVWLRAGRRVVSASQDGTARVWAVTADEMLSIAGRRLARGFSPEERVRYGRLLGDDGR